MLTQISDAIWHIGIFFFYFGTHHVRFQSMKVEGCHVFYPTLARELQGFRVRAKFVFRTLELTDTPTNLANLVKVGHVLNNHAVSNRADLRERTKTMSSHGDRRGQQIADFRDSFERINWLYLPFKCGMRKHFEWLIWTSPSLGQSALRSCGLQSANWPREDQGQRSYVRGFLLYHFRDLR